MYLPLIFELTIILTSAFFGGIISKKLKFPVVAGYLVVGIFVAALFQDKVKGSQTIPVLANIGIALLLFSNGLEFSLDRLSKATKNATFGAVVQVLLITLLGFLVFPKILGLNIPNSLILAFGISLSSTSIVLKILEDTKETRTIHGEIMIGWLIAQDLFTIPMIVLIPVFAKANGNIALDFGLAILKMLVVGYLILLLGKKFVPFVFEKVAKLSSKELMLVGSFALSLGLGLLTQRYLSSFALGAFLGGIVLSSSYVRFEINSEVRPLRDLFSAIFFVSIGFLLNPSYLLANFLQIILLVLFVLVLKFIVIFLIVSYLGFHTRISFLVALGLLEVGEFAFVLARTGVDQHVLTENTYQLIVSTTIVSLLLASYFMSIAKKLYKVFKSYIKSHSKILYNAIFVKFDKSIVSFPGEVSTISNHVILIGFGRVGKIIAKALSISKVPFIIIDYDFKKLEELVNTSQPFVYGDPVDDDILENANIEQAKLLVVAIPDIYASEHIIKHAKHLNGSVKIIGRVGSDEEARLLNRLGVKELIEPEFEASMTISEIILDDLIGDSKKGRKVLSEIVKEHLNA